MNHRPQLNVSQPPCSSRSPRSLLAAGEGFHQLVMVVDAFEEGLHGDAFIFAMRTVVEHIGGHA